MIEKQELRKQKLQRLEEEREKHNQLKEERKIEANLKKKQEQKNTKRGCLIIVIVVVLLLLLANYNAIYEGIKQLIGIEQPVEKNINNTIETQPIQTETPSQTQSQPKTQIQTIDTEDISSRSSQSSHNSNTSTPGKFPQASERLLTASDLQGLSKYDLKIMRNEIFARHGYIFQTTEMKNYFQNQSWYTPRYKDVSSSLSNTEQKNVALIKRYE